MAADGLPQQTEGRLSTIGANGSIFTTRPIRSALRSTASARSGNQTDRKSRSCRGISDAARASSSCFRTFAISIRESGASIRWRKLWSTHSFGMSSWPPRLAKPPTRDYATLIGWHWRLFRWSACLRCLPWGDRRVAIRKAGHFWKARRLSDLRGRLANGRCAKTAGIVSLALFGAANVFVLLAGVLRFLVYDWRLQGK